MAIPVVGSEAGLSVVASAHDGAGVLAVEVGYGGEEPVAAVAVGVAPIGYFATGRLEGHGGEGFSCLSLEYGEVFGAFEDASKVVTCLWL